MKIVLKFLFIIKSRKLKRNIINYFQDNKNGIVYEKDNKKGKT